MNQIELEKSFLKTLTYEGVKELSDDFLKNIKIIDIKEFPNIYDYLNIKIKTNNNKVVSFDINTKDVLRYHLGIEKIHKSTYSGLYYEKQKLEKLEKYFNYSEFDINKEIVEEVRLNLITIEELSNSDSFYNKRIYEKIIGKIKEIDPNFDISQIKTSDILIKGYNHISIVKGYIVKFEHNGNNSYSLFVKNSSNELTNTVQFYKKDVSTSFNFVEKFGTFLFIVFLILVSFTTSKIPPEIGFAVLPLVVVIGLLKYSGYSLKKELQREKIIQEKILKDYNE